jgi:hypothetical protein
MQWVQFHQASAAQLEEERIDQLARRFVFTGSALCVFVAAVVWFASFVG